MLYGSKTIRALACALLAALAAGCAGVPPLDKAEVTEVALASPAELSRFEAAKDLYYRPLIPEGLPALRITAPDWPTLRLAFQSRSQLFSPLEAGAKDAVVYPCAERNKDWNVDGLGSQHILWRGRVVDQEAARQIAQHLEADPQPQEYVIFFDYRYWDQEQPRAAGDPITLVPLPDDLCISLQKLRYPLAPSIGEPLRIEKDIVNKAVGPLPKSLAVPKPVANPAPSS